MKRLLMVAIYLCSPLVANAELGFKEIRTTAAITTHGSIRSVRNRSDADLQSPQRNPKHFDYYNGAPNLRLFFVRH
jgi:hypothetical protein